jgi:hypothetical protein
MQKILIEKTTNTNEGTVQHLDRQDTSNTHIHDRQDTSNTHIHDRQDTSNTHIHDR